MIQTNQNLTPTKRNLFTQFATGFLLCSSTFLSTAWADTEIDKINEDADRGSRFGRSVAISNDVAIIGASEESDRVSSSGAAYIYRNNEGRWQRDGRLILGNRSRFDRFGWSVDISGDAAIVGTNGSGNKVAVLYQYADNRWSETATLSVADEGINAFGRSVAVSGDVAIVGAPYSTINDLSSAGAAFIYRFNGTTWIEEAEFSDAIRDGAYFGTDVAVHNDLAVVGAPGQGYDESQGSVHVYRFNGESWVIEAELLPDEDITDDNFGGSVAVSNDVIVIGSPADDSNGENSGSAYVFRFDGTQWWQETKLIPSDGGSFERFGTDVAVTDSVAIVGAPYDDDNGRDAGSAYEFRHDGSQWIQTSKLTANEGLEIANLGASVSVSAEVALIGASGDSENGFISGAAYTFSVSLDTDGDGVADADDNCPSDWNPMQENFDDDLLGDVCDQDDDNDGLDDDQDPAPYNALLSRGPTPFSPVGNNILPGVDFEWAALPGAARYAIEVQHNGTVRAYEDMIIATVACNDGRCRYIKPDAALDGANRWRLRAGTSSGTSDWSPWTEFVVNGSATPIDDDIEIDMPATSIPALPQAASPIGAAVALGTDFRWTKVPGATHYSIEIQHNGQVRGYAYMLNTEQLCASDQCVYIKSDATQLGNNRWRLKAGNAIGTTEWTSWTDFTVALTTGSDLIIPAVPAPDVPAGTLTNLTPEFHWAAVTGATRYAIEIQHNGVIRAYDDAIEAGSACSESGCQYVKPDAALIGANRWRLRAGSSAGFSQWSEWQSFVLE